MRKKNFYKKYFKNETFSYMNGKDKFILVYPVIYKI